MTDDPIIAAARFLGQQLDWLRHATDQHGEPRAVQVHAEIAACAGKLRSLVNGRQPGRYAGPCSTEIDGKVCGKDVEAAPGSNVGKCRECNAEYDVDEQQAWMRTEIEDMLASPTMIHGILLRLGFPIGYSTIAAYAKKGRIVAHSQDGEGEPLYRIGDVVDVRMSAKAGPRVA